MLAFAAGVIFAIAFIINAAGVATDRVFDFYGLILLGLACLAVHQVWSVPWRRR